MAGDELEARLALGPVKARAARDDEERLVERLQRRSVHAWADLYDRYHEVIYRYALFRVRPRESAEDVAALVFQRALSSIDSYTYKGKPILAWLYGIAKNVVSEHLRSSYRRRRFTFRRGAPKDSAPTQMTNEDALVLLTDAGSDPDALVWNLDLYRALESLASSQREVLTLRYFVGLSTREIADIVGKPTRSIYALQARGLRALRSQLR